MANIYAADKRYVEEQQQQQRTDQSAAAGDGGDAPELPDEADDVSRSNEASNDVDGDEAATTANGYALDEQQPTEADEQQPTEADEPKRPVGEANKQRARKKTTKKLTDLDVDNATESEESDEYKAATDEEASADSDEELPSEDEYLPSDDKRCVFSILKKRSNICVRMQNTARRRWSSRRQNEHRRRIHQRRRQRRGLQAGRSQAAIEQLAKTQSDRRRRSSSSPTKAMDGQRGR